MICRTPIKSAAKSEEPLQGATESAAARRRRWRHCASPRSRDYSWHGMGNSFPTTTPAERTPRSCVTILRDGSVAIPHFASTLGWFSALRGWRAANERSSPRRFSKIRCVGAQTRWRNGYASQQASEHRLVFAPSERSTKARQIEQKPAAQRSCWGNGKPVVPSAQFPAGNTRLHRRYVSNPGPRSGSVAALGIAAVAQVRPQYNTYLYCPRTCAKGTPHD